jgi:very-short-patch-repair endonuclease
MYKKWTPQEIDFVKEKYESGMDLNDVYDLYLGMFGNERTKISIWLFIKRKKIRHTRDQTLRIKSKNSSGEKNGMFGKEPWTKGETKETSEKLRKASEKNSETRKNLYKNGILDTSGNKNGMFGKDPWNIGKNKFNDETMKRIGESVSIYQKNKWQNMNQNERDEIIGRLTKSANKNKKDTKIEKIIENLLINNSIAYEKQYKMGRFVTDFFIPQSNLVIECQGDYWHANPEIFTLLNETQKANIKRDMNKKEYFDANSIQYLFFWESEIKNHINLVLSMITEKIKPTFEQ